MWHRLVGHRFSLFRLLVLPSAALDVMVLEDANPSVWVWVFAMGAAVVSLAAGFAPLPTVLAQSALLFATDAVLPNPPIATIVLASLALLELTVRRWGTQLIVGASVLGLLYIGRVFGDVEPLIAFYDVGWCVAAPVLIGAYLRKLRETARLAQARAEDAEARRDLAEQAARLAERTAISRELHDVVAHHVASIALRVGVARHVLSDVDERVTEVLDDVHTAATSALADLRRLVRALRDTDSAPDDLVSLLVDPAELPRVLQSLVERSQAAGLSVTAEVDPAVATLDAVRGLVVLRSAQEGLTNVVKHGGFGAVATLRVTLGADGQAEVEVRNSGGAATVPGERGWGLVGLTERLEGVGGALSVGPVRDGWRLHACVPATGPVV